MKRHTLQWHTPVPLWDLALEDSGVSPPRFRRPAVLRFSNDTFMEDLETVLRSNPTLLSEYVAVNESWREPRAGWLPEPDKNGSRPLKCYLPAHSRFYLLVSSLVCKTVGLPDHPVRIAEGEQASFVMRRLVPAEGFDRVDLADPDSYRELAWLGDREKGVWTPLESSGSVDTREERLPLFTLTFPFEGGVRRVLGGLIPVGSREKYEGGGLLTSAEPIGFQSVDSLADPRMARFLGGPLAGLEQLAQASLSLDTETRRSLLLTLFELGRFLEQELTSVWEALEVDSSAGLGSDQVALFNLLNRVLIPAGPTWTSILLRLARPENRSLIEEGNLTDSEVTRLLGAALNRSEVADAVEEVLGGQFFRNVVKQALGDRRLAEFRKNVVARLVEMSTLNSDTAASEVRRSWMEMHLELAAFLEGELPSTAALVLERQGPSPHPTETELAKMIEDLSVSGRSWSEFVRNAAAERKAILLGETGPQLLAWEMRLDAIQVRSSAAEALAAGLEAQVATVLQNVPVQGPAQGSSEPVSGETLYVARNIYERPRCGKLDQPVLGEPSQPFSLASFFDPDAPVRPIQIRMPVDTSVEGLRRFPKGVSVLLSNTLRRQMQRAQNAGLENLMDGDAGSEPAIDLGMICSFSIPIITICALILLMIIVQLLNIVFWWLPFFRICAPLNLKS